MFAFIVGSGFSETKNFQKEIVETKYGNAEVYRGIIYNQECLLLLRHGDNHEHLPHHINYLANIMALQKLGATQIVSFSVVGSLDAQIPLAKILIPTDVYFPENRLPDGSICSIFRGSGRDRGHLICGSFFNSDLKKDIAEIINSGIQDATYVHSFGPRFNSKVEIKNFQSFGGSVISQTCGPEVVLSNELEIPFALVNFPIDYANGVTEVPTSLEELNLNLEKSQGAFWQVIEGLLKKKNQYAFEGFVYRL